jgi:hypothetical protein
MIGRAPSVDGFQPAGKLSLEEAFGVYQRGYVARLTETLGDTYEFVWRVLGDELFFEVCREFISLNPSQSYNLSDYSVKFIDFLVSHPTSQEFPFLADLAHLGWLHKEVFHSPAEPGLSGEEIMTHLRDDDREMSLIGSFKVLKSHFRLFDIWKALKDETGPPEEWRNPQCLALYKLDNQVYVHKISAKDVEFFENIRAGMDLMDACEFLASSDITSLFQFLGNARCLTKKTRLMRARFFELSL